MDLATVVKAQAHIGAKARRGIAAAALVAVSMMALPAYAQFTAKMDRVALVQVTKAEIAKNRSAKEIVAAMIASGVTLEDAVAAALDAGLTVAAVREAALAAGASDVAVASAIALTQSSLALTPGSSSQATAGGGTASAR